MTTPPMRQVRVFCDSDVLIAGSASTSGASHILLRLSELTLLECSTSQYAVAEAERNLQAKLPEALAIFRLILQSAVKILPDPSPTLLQEMHGQAHEKDMPILAAAIAGETDFLATFNVRHFQPRITAPLVLQPGKIVARVRQSLVSLFD